MTGGFHTHFDIVGASETSNTAILRESWQESGQDCLWGMCMVPAGFCPKLIQCGDEQQDIVILRASVRAGSGLATA
jgi:hypothetical protein